MPRRQHARELEPSRVTQWVKRMSEIKVVPGYGELDMQDPESIRAYIRHSLVLDEPTIAGLKRLEMLGEVADRLSENGARTGHAVIKLVDAKDAAAELERRLRLQREQEPPR